MYNRLFRFIRFDDVIKVSAIGNPARNTETGKKYTLCTGELKAYKWKWVNNLPRPKNAIH